MNSATEIGFLYWFKFLLKVSIRVEVSIEGLNPYLRLASLMFRFLAIKQDSTKRSPNNGDSR